MAALALVGGGAVGCGTQPRHHDGDAAGAVEREAAPVAGTCLASAAPSGNASTVHYPAGFPATWPWPPHTVVTAVEDRGRDGVVVSASSSASLAQVLHFLNTEVADAGFVVTSGETERHDAEANWSGRGYRGRWAIRESAGCAGHTAIQVLATDR